MTTQGVMPQALNLLRGTGKANSTSSTSNTSSDFEKFMGKGNKDSKQVVDKVTPTNKASGTEKLQGNAPSNISKTEKSTVSNTDNALKAVTKDSNQDITIDEVTVESLESEICDVVTELLGISKEDLEEAMAKLSLTAVQLLLPDNLAKLTLELNGESDLSVLLTNEELSNQLNQLIQGISDINLQELNLTDDDVKQLLLQAEQSKDTVLESDLIQQEQIVTREDDNAQKTTILPDTSGKDEVKPVDKTDITVEVEKVPTKESGSTAKENGSFNNKESKDNRSTNVFDTIVQGLENAGATKQVFQAEQTLADASLVKDIVNQIVEQIKVTIKPDMKSMEFTLNPENLGKVGLLVSSKEGVLTATLTTANAITKEALESQIQLLKDNLNAQGLKVDAVEVTVSNFTFEQSNQTKDQQQNNRGSSRRKISLEDLDSITSNGTEEEVLAAKIMADNGNSIDYTA